MAGWQAIYPCRLMPFPSGVLPTNRNMPWNSSWKIHLIPARLFFRPPRILSHQYESELERVFPSLSVTVSAGSLMDLCHHFWMVFAFHFYFFISLYQLRLHLSSAAARAVHPWKCAVLGITHLQMIWLCYTGGRPAVSRESDQPVNWYTWCYRSLKNISYIIKYCYQISNMYINKRAVFDNVWNILHIHIYIYIYIYIYI